MAPKSLPKKTILTQIGDVFGYWTVIGEAEPYMPDGKVQWLCRCVCGTERVVRQSSLRDPKRQNACGCIRKLPQHKNPRALRQSMYHTPTFRSYSAMKQRCLNPKHRAYKFYGGRGISICDRWLESFANFLEDMGERPDGHTIDRKDSDGNYEPSNCRWATRAEQISNTRNRVMITINGETKALTDWCRFYGVPRARVQTRLGLGWTPEEAFTAPADKSARRSSRQRILSHITAKHSLSKDWVAGIVHPRTLRRQAKADGMG